MSRPRARRLLLAGGLLLTGCETAPPSVPPVAAPVRGTTQLIRKGTEPTVERSSVLMGTEVRIVIVTEDRHGADRAITAALAEVERIENLMTDWKEIGQVAAINRAAGDHPVVIDRELYDLLTASRELSELTDGKFDITFAGAGKLWDFQADPPRPPSAEEIGSRLERVDYRLLELDPAERTAFLPRKGMRIGLGGIAKGYAVDRAVQILEHAGFEDFAVNAGGDLAIRGLKDRKLWWVGIREPRQPEELLAILPASNVSVATSGDYERFFFFRGQRYSHILDPRTGYPATGCQSVTILAPRTFFADALATGVFVLGPEAGLALVERLDNVEAVVVAADGSPHISSGLK